MKPKSEQPAMSSQDAGPLKSSKVRYLWLLALGILVQLPYWQSFAMINDEGITVHGARRWLQGEWPYYHWDSRHGPGAYALTAAFFSCFGQGQLATRLLMSILASLQGLVIYALSAPLAGYRRYFPWLTWSLIGMMDFPILGYHWLGVLCFCGLCLLIQRWIHSPTRASQVGLGMGWALTGFVLQSEALAGLLLIGLVWLRWRPIGLARVGMAALVGSLLLWAPFFPVWVTVVQDSFLDLRAHLLFNHHAYSWRDLGPLLWGARSSSLAGDPAGYAFSWLKLALYALKYGLYYPVLGLAAWLSIRRNNQTIQLICLAGICLTLANLNRQTLEYLSYLLPLWFILLYWLIPRIGVGLVGFVAAYWALSMGLTWRDCRHPILTPAGIYYTGEIRLAHAYARVGQWLQVHVRAGEQALCFPFQPCIYALWGLKNPVREFCLVPVSFPPSSFARAAAELKTQQVPWILFLPMDPLDCNVDLAYFAETQQQMLDFLTADYELVNDFRGMRLYRRRSFPLTPHSR